MILTLAWKEYREHRSIWFTMVLMTGVLALFLAEVIAPRDSTIARMAVPALTILGMAATYGLVCGSMMFAGEQEAGTMIFLDIFMGQRGLLWFLKFLIGLALAVTEALAVGLVLNVMKQAPPDWLPTFIGRGTGLGPGMLAPLDAGPPKPSLWYLVLPVVTLEAFAWGLLGSAMTRRVLAGAALAALIATPIWMVAVFMPPPVFVGLRLIAAAVALVISWNLFMTQSRDAPLGPPPKTTERKLAWVQGWEDGDDYELGRWNPVAVPERTGRRRPETRKQEDREPGAREPALLSSSLPVSAPPPVRRGQRPPEAQSPGEALLWLGFRQAWPVFGSLAGAILVIGLLVPAGGQILWPLATLLLGVACGTATFAQEQSDLSYQFLAAQHLPLKTVWKFKTLFWLTAAVVGALLTAGVATLLILARTLAAVLPRPGDPAVPVVSGFEFGSLLALLGPALFFGVWLLYGFCTAQVFVLLCRKAILAVLLSALVAAAAFALWLPSLLCKGMSGWQPWLAPLGLLLVTRLSMRAWAGGRIKERQPLALLLGFGVVAVAWVGVNCARRAWEVPDIGAPLDRVAFRDSIPSGLANPAGKAIQEALADMDQGEGKEGHWLARIAKVPQVPLGVIETPSGDGQTPLLRHLPVCRKMTDKLLSLSRLALAEGKQATAFEHLTQILALSRNLRNKAPLASYLAGVDIEELALEDVNVWLARAKPPAKLVRQVLDELNRHAAETPPPVDCLRTECFRAGGALVNPVNWTFYSGTGAGRVPERWLAGSIALSLDMPWEDARKTRLWQAVWAGLFRGLHTPHWELRDTTVEVQTRNEVAREVLRGWLPATEGPGASLTLSELASLVDSSWLADERLFAAVVPLRSAANRARWRVDSCRLTVALGLYQLQEKKTAQTLEDLIPKYMPELPVDPYSGKAFNYRISPREEIDMPDAQGRQARQVQRGQGLVWSTGPDKVDHDGHRHGGTFADAHPEWSRGGLDLIAVVPLWP